MGGAGREKNELLSLLPPSFLLSAGGTSFVHGVSRDTCKSKP